MSITDGQIKLSAQAEAIIISTPTAKRIYERLRKRSYRRQPWTRQGDVIHAAYVAGVRDALKEVVK